VDRPPIASGLSIRMLQMPADYMRLNNLRPDHVHHDQVVAWGIGATSGSALGDLVAVDGLGFSPKTTPLVEQLSALPALGPFSPTDPSISGMK
jgi:hypothetical protein